MELFAREIYTVANLILHNKKILNLHIQHKESESMMMEILVLCLFFNKLHTLTLS
jgi:hypothetical protein